MLWIAWINVHSKSKKTECLFSKQQPHGANVGSYFNYLFDTFVHPWKVGHNFLKIFERSKRNIVTIMHCNMKLFFIIILFLYLEKCGEKIARHFYLMKTLPKNDSNFKVDFCNSILDMIYIWYHKRIFKNLSKISW